MTVLELHIQAARNQSHFYSPADRVSVFPPFVSPFQMGCMYLSMYILSILSILSLSFYPQSLEKAGQDLFKLIWKSEKEHSLPLQLLSVAISSLLDLLQGASRSSFFTLLVSQFPLIFKGIEFQENKVKH